MMTYANEYDTLLEDSNLDYCEALDDKLDRGDYHCWVVDSDGKCVFDYDEFFELDYIKGVRRCIPNTETIRIPFQDQSKSVRFAIQSAVDKQKQSEDYGIPWEERWFNQVHKGKNIYQWRMCNVNCLNFLKMNKGKGYKLVVGATGWKTKDDEYWFEWG